MYKTGDLARWCKNGNIDYIGRVDLQVKIRGLRIELGEIESVLATIETISQVVVLDRQDDNGRLFLCAYYVSECEIEEKILRIELAKTLPRYMIPHFFIKLKSLPITSNGKIDGNSLPLPDYSQPHSNADYITPITEQEIKIIQILESVLGVSPIGMNDDFFDVGGDSLKAIEFISKAQYEGLNIDVQTVFEYSTPAELLKHIGESDKQTARYHPKEFDALHELLKHSKTSARVPTGKHTCGDVLITGATGWLGIHVLDEFLTSEQGIAYCLVRGENTTDSRNKLISSLEYYFGDKHKDNMRIIAIFGDITSPLKLDEKIDTIIHCAANVKHYGAFRHSYDANVAGTNNIIELAKEKDAVLLHISTASVSGNSFEQPPDFPKTIFNETSLYIGQPLENVYIRSKFEAEVAVLEARANGLDAKVIRVGNLANRSSDLVFQKNYQENATLTRIKALADLRMYPRQLALLPIELSPVDDTAKAIIMLAQHHDNVRIIHHLYNDKSIRFGSIVKALKSSGIKMKAVSMKRFLKELTKTVNNPEKSHIYETFINDIDEKGALQFNSSIILDNSHSIQYLNEIGFNWSKIDTTYLRKYVEYFHKIGYFGGVTDG